MTARPKKMLLQRDGRCGEVVVSGGSTVVRTIMKLIPLSSFCSYFVASIVGMFYSFFEVKSRLFEGEYIKKSMTSSVLMYSTGAKHPFYTTLVSVVSTCCTGKVK